MLGFWNFFIAKKQFSYLILVALVLFGVFSLVIIPKESAPEVRVPVGIVTTILPGASPEDVERLVTNEIEEQLQGNLTDVKKITSTSGEGFSSVVAEFEANADLDASIQELRDEVAKVVLELPSESETPVVSDVNFVDEPIILFSISGSLGERAFSSLARDVENEIERISGMSRVSKSGVQDREISILVDQKALTRLNLSILDVVQAIRTNDAALPVGEVTLDSVNYAVTFEGEIAAPEDLLDVAIISPTGVPVFLRDVAVIEDDFEDVTTFSRVSLNGNPSEGAVLFNVYKRQGGDITAITSAVRDRLEEMQQKGGLLEGLDVLIVYDTGDYLIQDLTNLSMSGLQAIILVAILLLVALGWREAIIAGAAIPISFLVAFIGLQATGNTINFVSLFSLILAIGILVDAAIVIVEAIHANMKASLTVDKEEAARAAITTFQWPLIAGTFTTIAVFAPLFLISGVTGQFIANIPFTIINVLLAALFVALGIIPVIASVFLRRRMTSRMEEKQEEYTKRVQAWYREKLTKILDSRHLQKRIIIGSIIGFILAILLPIVGLVQVEFFPQEDSDFIFVDIEHPEGSVLETSDITIRRIEEALYDDKSIDSFVTTVGQSNAFSGGGSSDERFANLFILLDENREETSTEVVERLRDELSFVREATVRVSQPSSGPPVGDPVVITFTGNNFDDLEQATISAKRLLEDIEGTVDVRTSLEENSTQFALSIDRARAAQLGVSPLTVAQILRTSIYGSTAATLKVNGDDIDVVVKLSDDAAFAEDPLAAANQISIQTARGSVLLGSLVATNVERGTNAIHHEEGDRVATVSSDLTENGNAIVVLREFADRAGQELNLPATVAFSTGGENEDAEQAFQDMFVSLALGIILMLAILVIQFNSFRYALYVLSIVPLSLIGVFLGLTVSGNPISFPSMMGFIALTGIVVNNSIILIDVMNALRRENERTMTLKDVVVEGSVSRLRPIVLTAITTIIGVTPLIFVSELWGPIAYAIMFGLSFAVLITLVLIPVIYYRWPGTINPNS